MGDGDSAQEAMTPEVGALVRRVYEVAQTCGLSPSRVSTLTLGGGAVLARLEAGGDMRTRNIRRSLAKLDELAATKTTSETRDV